MQPGHSLVRAQVARLEHQLGGYSYTDHQYQSHELLANLAAEGGKARQSIANEEAEANP